MKQIIIFLISFYQTYLSFDKGILAIFAPGGACKSFPTCSQYTKQMVQRYGIIKGFKLGGKKILLCK